MTDLPAARVRPKLLDYLLAATVILVPLVLFARAMRPDVHPELLPQISGCYVGQAPYQRLRLRLDASGSLETDRDAVHVQVEKDKIGLTITPASGVMFNNDGSGHFDVGHASPMYLRLDSDLKGFSVPNLGGPSLHMHRTSC